MPTDGPVPALILASGSPRRRELLARLGVPFEVRPADVDESVRPGERAEDLVRRLAVSKAEVALAAATEVDLVVLAADTVVVIDDDVLGKPRDASDAAPMLRRLSGRSHRVLTGVAVARRTPSASGRSAVGPTARPAAGSAALRPAAGSAALRPAGPAEDEVWLGPATSIHVEVEATAVTFRVLSDVEIAAYVATGEPLDKAGAYGIQGGAAAFVDSVDGDVDNVIGLGLTITRRLLAQAGLTPAT